jgi:hypothetical protein
VQYFRIDTGSSQAVMETSHGNRTSRPSPLAKIIQMYDLHRFFHFHATSYPLSMSLITKLDIMTNG